MQIRKMFGSQRKGRMMREDEGRRTEKETEENDWTILGWSMKRRIKKEKGRQTFSAFFERRLGFAIHMIIVVTFCDS